MALRSVLVACLAAGAGATLYCAKRTFASPDGAVDEAFWTTYFGPSDSDSLRDAGGLGEGVCLTRYLQYALPSHFGVHFPTSTVTPEGAVPLANWTRARKAALDAAFGAGGSAYSAWADHATAFYVPSLDAHVAAFEAGAVGVLRRSYAAAETGARVYVATVSTPSSAQVLELHSPRCGACNEAEWPAYDEFAGECAGAHALPRSMGHYDRWWNKSAADAGWLGGLPSADAGGAALPIAMVAQLRVAVSRLADARRYYGGVWPELALSEGSESRCGWFRASVRSASYDVMTDGPHPYTDYLLDVLVLENRDASARDAAARAAYEAYVQATHAQFVGVNGGMDRFVDEHFRIESDATPVDEFARRLEALGDASAAANDTGAALARRYHAFDWGTSCPGADLTLAGYMIYSAGFGAQSVEIGADTADFSHFSNASLFAIDPCSATYACRAFSVADADADRESDEEEGAGASAAAASALAAAAPRAVETARAPLLVGGVVAGAALVAISAVFARRSAGPPIANERAPLLS